MDDIIVKLCNQTPGPIIKKSTIPNIGFGLFADKDYKKKENITVYGGKLYYHVVDGPYIFRLQENPPIYVDGKDGFDFSEKGRYANHGYESDYLLNQQFENIAPVHMTANTEYYVTKKNGFPICYLRALRSIKKGEELFVDYGPLYW